MARLFVAVRPPARTIAAIADLPRPAEPGVRWVPPEQWHITMRFLGEADADEVAARIDGLDGIDRVAGAAVTLGPRVSRLGRSVICLPAEGLDVLASFVALVTRDLGQPPDPRPFRGHLTLARLRGRAACGLAGHHLGARFEAREVELVASTLARGGARHEVVRRWPLAAPVGDEPAG